MACFPLPREDLEHVLAHTRDLWVEARGKSFFITGGTGFLGMWLLESFAHANDILQLGMRAVVLTRDPAAFAQKAPHLVCRSDLEFVAGDVRDFPFPPGRFDYVIHGATSPSVGNEDGAAQTMREVIIGGTRRVLEFSKPAEGEKFLYISSGAIYGRQPAELSHLPEDFPGADNRAASLTVYGESKLLAEQDCIAYGRQTGCEVKIARCFAFVGPHLPLEAHYAVGNFIGDCLAGRPVRLSGDGTAVRSYLYAADLAVWLWTILFRGARGRPYNVGSADALSMAEIACEVCEALGNTSPVVFGMKQLEAGSPNRYVPDITRAANELGLQKTVCFKDAVCRTARWHKQFLND
jgi:dTDP-glucose 4,6-dehydratase